MVQSVMGGNPWLTGRTVDDQTTPIQVLRDAPDTREGASAERPARKSASVSGGMIDLVISIYTNKPGDNNGATQGNAGSEAQDKIERIVQYLADGVYEMSQGAHRLRNVRIFQDGRNANAADIVWLRTGGTPQVPNKGGIGEVGGKVVMYDVGVWPDGSTYDFIANGHEQAAGYCLAHEWGHYFYGLYDEYKYSFNPNDVAVDRSIMNSQWHAVGGDYDWLNFSIAYQSNNPTGPWVNTKKTPQHREMNASCWEVLARHPSNDPTTHVQFDLGRRIYYPEVAVVAPSGTNAPSIQLPSTAARSVLNIQWSDPTQTVVVVLDRSGSMSGSPLQNARTAAKHLIDIVPNGSQVGVIAFDDTLTRIAAIQIVTSDVVRALIKGQIDAITAGNTTAIGSAANLALSDLTPFAGQQRAVFLLSDGYSNTGVDPLTVVPAYQNAQIPIMGFGYGTSVDPRLSQMSSLTGGKYYSSPTDYTTIALAFQDAFGYINSSPAIASGSKSMVTGLGMKPLALTFMVDSTIASLTAVISYNGATNDASLLLYAPGVRTGIAPRNVTSSGGQSLWLFKADHAAPGSWLIKGSARSGLGIDYRIDASEDETTFGLRVDLIGGSAVTSPAPVTIQAFLHRGIPIDNAKVTAKITTPDGLLITLPLVGAGAGLYTGTFLGYSRNGVYEVEVYAENTGAARFTYKGALMSLPPTGVSPSRTPTDQIVKEKFSRDNQTEFTVSGVTYSPVGTLATWAPRFFWPGDTNALFYTLEIWQSGKKYCSRSTSKGVCYYQYPKPMPLGTYQWRVGKTVRTIVQYVKGKPVYGNVTTWSAYQTITRVAIVPGIIAKIAPCGEELLSDINLQWQADAKAQSYRITLQSSSDGISYRLYKQYVLVPKTPDVDRYSVKGLRPGFYRWYIQGSSFDGVGPADTVPMPFHIR